MKDTNIKLQTLFTVLSIMAILSVIIGGYLYYSALSNFSIERAHKNVSEQLQIAGNDIDSYLTWSLLSVKSLAGLKEIKQSVLSKDANTPDDTNTILDRFRDDFKVSVCYLMNRSGKTIASSNRNDTSSFVGKNYSFRPYFKQAMQGIPTVYLALGVTSKKRGIYYSHPVYGEDKQTPLGVAVIKAPVELIEENLMTVSTGIVLLIDPHGVVFFSSRTDWLYQILWKPSSKLTFDIAKTKQFGRGPWNWTGIKLIDEDNAIDNLGDKYRVHQQELAKYPGWHLVSLQSHKEVMKKISIPLRNSVGASIITLCVIFGLICFLLFMQANNSIIQRKKVEKAFQESKDELKSIFRAAPTGIGLVYGRIIQQANDRLCEMIGYSRDELVGQNARILYPTDKDYEYVGKEKYRQIKMLGTGTVETRFKRKDDEIIDVLMSSTPIDPNNLSAGVSFTALDITERKQIEEELRISEERYREYFEENISGTYISTPEGRLIACNQEYRRIFGFDSIKHALDTPIYNFFKNSNERVEFLNMIKKEKRVTGFEPKLTRLDGTPFHLIENASGIFDKDGNLEHIKGFLLDVTEQKKLEAQLQQAQKMEAIGTLAGGIAHDFNNILSGIFGYSQLAQIHLKNPEKANKHIEQILKGAQRASDLIKQILTFSRQSEYQKQPFKIYLEVKEALKLLRSSIPSTIEIKSKLDSKKMVLADPIEIHQVLMNLCTNASHAMRKTGGHLTVSLTDVEISDSKIFKGKKMAVGEYIKLEVSDTGHGMDTKTMERTFEPYFTTKEKGDGTGLGLALVQAIVEEHDGFCEVKSEPAKGTSFYLYFPVARENEEKNIPKIEKESRLTGNEKIMFVDDEEAIREVTKEILERHGYEVILKKNGIDALKKFEKDIHQFDLIITDMNMPGMAGDILSTELKKINPDIPIILCTGFSDTMTEEKSVAIGINGFLMKPIEMNVLCQTIRQLFDKKE